MLIQSGNRKKTEELSGIVINSSGDLQPDPQIKIEQQRRLVSIVTIVLAVLNISLEATLQILEALGRMEHRSAILSTTGVLLVAVSFFTIPIRNRTTMIANTVVLVSYLILYLTL